MTVQPIQAQTLPPGSLPIGNPIIDVPAPEDTDRQLVSVTTAIGCLEKPALLGWAAEETAKAAVRVAGTLSARIEEEGPEAVVEWLVGARYRRPKGKRSATELGTAVHDVCHSYAISGVRPETDDEVRPYLDQFDRWAQRTGPKFLAAEMTVYSLDGGYAGTCDAIMVIDGATYIVDYKSSNRSFDRNGNPTKPWPEVALQLAAYRGASRAATTQPRRYESNRRRMYLYGAEEQSRSVPVPSVDTGLAVHITPEHCEAYPVQCGAKVHERFLHIVEASRWSEMSRGVIGGLWTP